MSRKFITRLFENFTIGLNGLQQNPNFTEGDIKTMERALTILVRLTKAGSELAVKMNRVNSLMLIEQRLPAALFQLMQCRLRYILISVIVADNDQTGRENAVQSWLDVYNDFCNDPDNLDLLKTFNHSDQALDVYEIASAKVATTVQRRGKRKIVKNKLPSLIKIGNVKFQVGKRVKYSALHDFYYHTAVVENKTPNQPTDIKTFPDKYIDLDARVEIIKWEASDSDDSESSSDDDTKKWRKRRPSKIAKLHRKKNKKVEEAEIDEESEEEELEEKSKNNRSKRRRSSSDIATKKQAMRKNCLIKTGLDTLVNTSPKCLLKRVKNTANEESGSESSSLVYERFKPEVKDLAPLPVPPQVPSPPLAGPSFQFHSLSSSYQEPILPDASLSSHCTCDSTALADKSEDKNDDKGKEENDISEQILAHSTIIGQERDESQDQASISTNTRKRLSIKSIQIIKRLPPAATNSSLDVSEQGFRGYMTNLFSLKRPTVVDSGTDVNIENTERDITPPPLAIDEPYDTADTSERKWL